MAIKTCRHPAQALRIVDFRKALRHHDALGCELCSVPPARGNSRSKPLRRRTATSPATPDQLSDSSASTASSGSNSTGGSPLSAVQTLKGWAPNPTWEDLYICITCGHMACLGKNHLMQHFQIHPKHFVGFHMASRTFWCCPCKQEVDSTEGKTVDSLRECGAAFDEIATRQQRRVRSRLVTHPNLSPEDDDEYPDSQRSYVGDVDSSDRSGLRLDELQGPVDEPATQPHASRTGHGHHASARPPVAPVAQVLVPVPTIPQVVATKMNTIPTVLGFSNLGNTCYFNAATQALLTALHCFPSYIHDEEVITRMADSPIAATLMMLNQTILKKTRNSPAPSSTTDKKSTAANKKNPVLTVAPLLKEMRKKFGQFRGSYQQDAHELFTSLLWAIDEEIDPPPKPQPHINDPPEQQLVNVFVQTDTGETITLRVAQDASTQEIQALLAKKLSLDDRDFYLQQPPGHSSSRQSHAKRRASSSASSASSEPLSYSRINFVRSLFSGELTTEVRCSACGNCSETVEDAFQLSLPIPNAANGKSLSIKHCLNAFTSATLLQVETENGYECDNCSSPPDANTKTVLLRDATMRQRISDLPRMLVLHLKRLGRLRKITQHIQFDAMLDMATHVEDEVLERHASTLYELVAVVVHKGNKRAGHYVAYVSRKKLMVPPAEGGEDDDRERRIGVDDFTTTTTRSTLWHLEDPDHDWFYVSDSLVQSVPFDQVLKCEAYMLFYQQCAPSDSQGMDCLSSFRHGKGSTASAPLAAAPPPRASHDPDQEVDRESMGDWI